MYVARFCLALRELSHALRVQVWLSYLALAMAYCANNQLTFVILETADPGTLTLAKSSTPCVLHSSFPRSLTRTRPC